MIAGADISPSPEESFSAVNCHQLDHLFLEIFDVGLLLGMVCIVYCWVAWALFRGRHESSLCVVAPSDPQSDLVEALSLFKMLCRQMQNVQSIFEEFNLRINVLRTNPHIKNFFDRLIEIEKTVKAVLEIMVDWIIFQRNWLYLNGIFAKSEISKQLAAEVRQFHNLDTNFKLIIKSIYS